MSCLVGVLGGEVLLLYNVVSASAGQQRDSAVSMHTAPPSHLPQPTPLYPQRDGLPKPSSLLNAQLPMQCGLPVIPSPAPDTSTHSVSCVCVSVPARL